jgi:hypothetical protein
MESRRSAPAANLKQEAIMFAQQQQQRAPWPFKVPQPQPSPSNDQVRRWLGWPMEKGSK